MKCAIFYKYVFILTGPGHPFSFKKLEIVLDSYLTSYPIFAAASMELAVFIKDATEYYVKRKEV
jgi:hypothetical protein